MPADPAWSRGDLVSMHMQAIEERDALAEINNEILAHLKAGLSPEHLSDYRGPCLCSRCEWTRAAKALIAKTQPAPAFK
jgi:hypothetical protein